MAPTPTIRILCFGDSNTWGYIPGSGQRFNRDQRWSALLSDTLAEHSTEPTSQHFEVLEDGVNGRTTCFFVPFRRHAVASKRLPKVLKRAERLDVIILALGINDCKISNARTVSESALGIETLLNQISTFSPNSRVLLLAPPAIPEKKKPRFPESMYRLSHELAPAYRAVARKRNIAFVDAGESIAASAIDGIHFDAQSHRTLAQVLAKAVVELLDLS